MYKSIQIKNFRLFNDFKIDGLERINLISGDNNVGKTSLLETIFIQQHPSNPRMETIINGMRGYNVITGEAKDVWGSLFNWFNLDNRICINSVDEDNVRRKFEIAISELGEEEFQSNENGFDNVPEIDSRAVSTKRMEIYYSENGSPIPVSRSLPVEEGQHLQSKKVIRPPCHYLADRTRIDHNSIAEKYSYARKDKKHLQVIDALQIIDNRISDIEVLTTRMGPILHADISGPSLLPLYAMGGGLERLIGIILLIINSKDGITLIDEIENGFYYAKMEKIWEVIYKMAEQNNTQIFATTHSQECIYYANKAFSEMKSKDFKFYRLSRKDDNIEAIPYDLELLNTAIEMNLEIR